MIIAHSKDVSAKHLKQPKEKKKKSTHDDIFATEGRVRNRIKHQKRTPRGISRSERSVCVCVRLFVLKGG